MRLLFLCEKMDANDDVLAFTHRWVAELSQYVDTVTVVCLSKGAIDLPDTVTVHSLGKEDGASRFTYLRRLYSYIWKYRKDYDQVYVHMIVEYVLLGGFLWKLMRKPIALWYAHGHVSPRLRLAEILVNIIFTSTPKGCRLDSKKIRVLHQGIDIKQFTPRLESESGQVFTLVTVGRISPVKGYGLMIHAVDVLKQKGIELRADIIGAPGTPSQEIYLEELKHAVRNMGLDQHISFVGSVPNKDLAEHLQKADLFVNMSTTGSLDKAILEAMACGTPILTCNDALVDVLGSHTEKLMYEKNNVSAFVQKIEEIYTLSKNERTALGVHLRDIVVKQHSVTALIKKIFTHIQKNTPMKKSPMSLLRRLEYDALSKIESINGKVLDLGGDRRSGYHERMKGEHDIFVVNINPDTGCDLCFDIQQPFPMEDGSYDGIVCMNVLEHIFDYQTVLNEGFRVLKSGGRFVGCTPFLFHVHGSPDDYFRYTGSALKKMFERAGFTDIHIHELGTGVFSTRFQLQFGLYRPRFVKRIAEKIHLVLDYLLIKKFLTRIRPSNHLSEKHVPLGYFFIAKK
ncbi:MAG: hypothetical protein COU35_03970 [Candidatus Magasanikbacteria bacterium CG10_big_fil_rev_8_21_14_0_10_47_10]|uniref:Glycosyl transferase family 1 domain-containing protein n=1 Tax=Candidatus Magasanikbacteria bacterium CG10_big_fil_rev_8_21_14_0_10_47_10 TaxID=1974652 RepID=A0A2H0TPU7_9BACT|nr:MAG: hypothetical protein COU35_03970 [Candidatus Magasanikbacteria bacterium CG10_big_fil_rev_8_21_14_0_10_47_10]